MYRECSVDQPARLDRHFVTIHFRPPSNPPPPGVVRCMEAEVEMVVGTDGRPEGGTWRLVRSTDPSFADAVLLSVPGWRFEPARRDALPVRQIVREQQVSAIAVTVARSGAPPRAAPRC